MQNKSKISVYPTILPDIAYEDISNAFNVSVKHSVKLSIIFLIKIKINFTRI